MKLLIFMMETPSCKRDTEIDRLCSSGDHMCVCINIKLGSSIFLFTILRVYSLVVQCFHIQCGVAKATREGHIHTSSVYTSSQFERVNFEMMKDKVDLGIPMCM